MLAPTGGLLDGILVGIPVNRLRASMSRLSSVLAPAERAQLTMRVVIAGRPGPAHDLDTPVDLATLTGAAALPAAIGRRSSRPLVPWSEEAV